MNDIVIPKAYRHLMPRTYRKFEDYKPEIRKFIENNPKRPLTIRDFREAVDSTTAMNHVKTLMKFGYITRKAIKADGARKYIYEWHVEPLNPTKAALANGQVVTHDLNLPEFTLTLDNMPVLLHEYAQEHPAEIAAAHSFVYWLNKKNREVITQRERILKGDKS